MVWFLIILLVLVFIVNEASVRLGMFNLNYSLELGKDMAEIGEEIEVYSTIENEKPFVVSFIRVYERFRKGFNRKNNIYSLFIMPYERVRRSYKIYGIERGKFPISEIKIEIGDFIGLKSENHNFIMDRQVVILPKKEELKELIKPLGSLIGDTSVKRWILEDPLMTTGIREYTGNEPERFIHWPSSLRYGELMVKNFDFTTDNSVMILLNIETMKPSYERIDGEIIEEAIKITRSVMEEFEASKIPYGFACNSYNYDSDYEKGHLYYQGLGKAHLNRFLKILGSMDYKVGTFFKNTINDISKLQGNYSTVVIVTPKILEDYIEPINALSKSVNRTVVISVEDENLGTLGNHIIKYRGR